jgi:hypothetical protein
MNPLSISQTDVSGWIAGNILAGKKQIMILVEPPVDNGNG